LSCRAAILLLTGDQELAGRTARSIANTAQTGQSIERHDDTGAKYRLT